MKRYKTSGPLIGVCSLLTVFSVLCLCVFSILTLSTAQAEKRLADSSVQSVTDAYAAEVTAHEIFAQIRNGKQLSEVSVCENVYSYSVPVRQDQVLEVELLYKDERWIVQRWQFTHHFHAQEEDSISVWDGNLP